MHTSILRPVLFSPAFSARQLQHSILPILRAGRRSFSFVKTTGIVGLGLGAFTLSRPTVFCDPLENTNGSVPSTEPLPLPEPDIPLPFAEPPKSSISVIELSFGTVAGICAGVFIKKGAKFVAFCLGGIFVLLQFLGHSSIIKVDWNTLSSRFESLVYTKDVTGKTRPPTVGSIWSWLVNFIAADIQPRATFVTGLLLGLRIG